MKGWFRFLVMVITFGVACLAGYYAFWVLFFYLVKLVVAV